jgi:hypothetical protein
MEFVNLSEAEASARERLPYPVYCYYAGGAHDEITLAENRRAYDQIALRPRVLVDVSRRDLSTTVLGERVALPVLVAPMAFQRMAHPDGELATVRAVEAAGSIMTLSTLSTASVEDVRAATTRPLWFQLYVHQDRSVTRALIERVEALGYGALVLTVDTPVLGRRERDVRNEFQLPPGITIANVLPGGSATLGTGERDSALAAYFAGRHDASLTWGDLEWLRSATRLPVLLKGVLRADDAARAAEHGAAGRQRPDEQAEQRQYELIDLAERHGVLEGLPREEDGRQRERGHRPEPHRPHDPDERGGEQHDAQRDPRGDSVAPLEHAEGHERQHGERRIRKRVDVHEVVVGVQRAEPARLGHQCRVAVYALHAAHSGVVERRSGAIEVRARVEDREVARVAVACRLHRPHGEASSKQRDDERQRQHRDRHTRPHRASSAARA